MECNVDILDFSSIKYAIIKLNGSFIIFKQEWHRLFYPIYINHPKGLKVGNYHSYSGCYFCNHGQYNIFCFSYWWRNQFLLLTFIGNCFFLNKKNYSFIGFLIDRIAKIIEIQENKNVIFFWATNIAFNIVFVILFIKNQIKSTPTNFKSNNIINIL